MRGRLPTGPLLVLAGGAGFLAVSLMTWYAVDLAALGVGTDAARRFAAEAGFATSANAWEPWGLITDSVYLATVLGGLGLGAAGLAGLRSRGAAIAAMLLGATTTVTVFLHLVSEPSPAAIVEVQPVAWLGCALALTVLVGGFVWLEQIQHAGEPAVRASSAAASGARAPR